MSQALCEMLGHYVFEGDPAFIQPINSPCLLMWESGEYIKEDSVGV